MSPNLSDSREKPIRSCSVAGCARNASISADRRSARCIRPGSNASARARRASALRIRPQGVDRHHAASLGRRTVHRPRQGAARQSLRRPHTRDRDPGDRDADRREPCPHRRRPAAIAATTAPPGHKFTVYISGQRRRVTETIKRELRRRSAVEPVIGHAKAEHRIGPKLPRRNPRRRRQRLPRRRRLQLPPRARMQSWQLAKRPPLSRGRSNWPESVLHGRLLICGNSS
jgi:hypothetical protein